MNKNAHINIAFLLVVGLCYQSPFAIAIIFTSFAAYLYLHKESRLQEQEELMKAISSLNDEMKKQKDLTDRISSKVFAKDLYK